MSVGGAHDFAVPNEARARGLAEALSRFGFPRVDAFPAADGWRVRAFDEGPHPAGLAGHRQFEAGGRAAARIARDHGGFNIGGYLRDADRVYAGQPTAPVSLTRPGAAPLVPAFIPLPPPPHATLTLDPGPLDPGPLGAGPLGAGPLDPGPLGAGPLDPSPLGAGPLGGLDAVAWPALTHAHGPADDVPELLATLADPGDPDWDDVLAVLLFDELLHQGECYPATAAAIHFLAGLVPSLGQAQRLAVCGWLLMAAGRWGATLIDDEAAAFATGRAAIAAPFTEPVRAAVASIVPALLSRWEVEPAPVRLVLAGLAAQFPASDGPTAAIAAFAESVRGTVEGAYLNLALALVDHDDEQTRRRAEGIVAWDDGQNPGALDAATIPIAVVGSHILAEGILRTVFS